MVFALANDVAKDPAVASFLPGWGRGPCALPSRLHAARIGFFEDQQLGFAAHHALEAQHGECPRKGFIIAFALDGTVTAVHTPVDEELKLLYWLSLIHI